MRPYSLPIVLSLIMISSQQICYATDFDPVAPPAGSVSGASGNNAGQVNLAIQESSEISDDSKHVNVLYKDGAIILTGTVVSDRDRQEIGNIAAKGGCVNIRNEIKVKQNTPKKAQ